MKFLLAGAFVVCSLVPGIAQTKLDLGSRSQLRSETVIRKLVKSGPMLKSVGNIKAGESAYKLAMVIMADGEDAESLIEEGVNVLRTRGNIAFISVETEDIDRVASLDCIKKMQLGRPVYAKMDKARAASGVDKIHQGIDLPQSYTGKGVICGIVDNGFDPFHINFADENGNMRIKQLSNVYTEDYSTIKIRTYTPDNMSAFTTDDLSTFHGTHTTGIMAGGYRGEATVAVPESDPATGDPTGQSKNVAMANPYYGVAYDSDIVAAYCQLNDIFIAYGIEEILNYAYDAKKPAVVNLSLGSNIGTHDGRSVMSKYLDAVSPEAIICVSSGNEGDLPIALNRTFVNDGESFQTFIYPYAYNGEFDYNGTPRRNLRYGSVYIYSDTDEEFEFQAVVYNNRTGRINRRFTVSTNMEGSAKYYVSSSNYAQSDDDYIDQNLAKAFDGYVGVGSMTDSDTGRYYGIIDFFTIDNAVTNSDNQYLLGFIVKGKAGQRIDCFSDGAYTYFDDYGIAGWEEGSTNGSISDMATAHNTIAVGAYNTRDNWASLDGYCYGYDGKYEAGKITDFSSYGTLIDGRNLPDVCAPGATIISSTNKYFVDILPDEDEYGIKKESYLNAGVTSGGRDHYYEQMSGTSMACPYVAGSIALWLEADPTLTYIDVKDIIQKTAIKDSDVATEGDAAIKWGAGKFDAYAGLKEVLRRQAGVENVSIDGNRPVVSVTGNRQIGVFVPGEASIKACLYNISGQCILMSEARGDEMSLDASAVAPGVYVLTVNGSYSTKVAIR